MSLITECVEQYIPPRNHRTPSGWISFNCVACQYQGHSPDTRQRAGIIFDSGGVSYSCFNCNYKAHWKPGQKLSNKMKQLMIWLGIPETMVGKCLIESLKDQSEPNRISLKNELPTFTNYKLPNNFKYLKDSLDDIAIVPYIDYITQRGLDFYDYDWAIINDRDHYKRLVIPFYYRNRIVGYTARHIGDVKKYRYKSEQQPGYVFNMDNQTYNKKFVLLFEGIFDAISMGGIAIMGQTLNGGQYNLINSLRKDVIVVPDKDRSGKELVDDAIKFNWKVSFPQWDYDIKDANDAVKRYGKLYTMYNILKNVESSELLIKTKTKWWFND